MKKKELGYRYSKNDLHSINDESFYTKKQNSISSINWPETGLVDHLIDYLTEHLTVLGDRDERLNKFETQVADVLNKCSEPDLHRIFKEQGWTGSHFQLSIEPPFIDAQSCLNALSNYYLKINSQPALVDLTAADTLESHQLDQILPFCPDVVVTYLKRQPITSSSSGPRRLTFKGACMLADISGFSKFSGAMCSKGVSGLDDLREATNGFLGYFVKQVYEYEGDGECSNYSHGKHYYYFLLNFITVLIIVIIIIIISILFDNYLSYYSNMLRRGCVDMCISRLL